MIFQKKIKKSDFYFRNQFLTNPGPGPPRLFLGVPVCMPHYPPAYKCLLGQELALKKPREEKGKLNCEMGAVLQMRSLSNLVPLLPDKFFSDY